MAAAGLSRSRRAPGDQRSARKDALQPYRGGEVAGHHVSRDALPDGAVGHQMTSRRAARLTVDAEGLAPSARYIESPNCDERPRDTPITLAVVHGISLPPGEFGGPGIIDLFTNRLDAAEHPYYGSVANLRVSAHFVIRRDGELLQFVPCT